MTPRFISVAAALAATAVFSSASANAEVLWQDFSATYLQGNNYRVESPKKQVLTLEHVAATSWGDSFFFLDHMREENGSRTNYAEWSPRLSLSKTTSKSFQYGFINDILISTNMEMSSLQTNFLYGMGLDLKVPGFQFMQLNGYRRNNDGMAGNWQLTSSWGLPIKLANQEFLYDGFIDWTSTNSEQRSSFNMTSQLKWALHSLFGMSSPLYVGVEYVYWRNKYGIADSPLFRTNESNLNLLVKAHF